MQSVILSSNQVHRLHHRFYEPTGDVKANLLIVHGMSEHSGRYDAFAKFLAEHGILVATYDQLGHGQTVKDKYELGFFDEKHPVQTFMQRCHHHGRQAQRKSTHRAAFYHGSFDGFVHRAYSACASCHKL